LGFYIFTQATARLVVAAARYRLRALPESVYAEPEDEDENEGGDKPGME